MDAGEQPKGETRRYPRSVAVGRPLGRVNNAYNVSLIDISLGGVQIEHPDIIRPGTTSFLTLLMLGREVTLNCRVVRSLVHRTEVQADGEQQLIHRSGLEFLGPSEESLRQIDGYIESLKRQSPDAESEVLT